MEIKFNVTKERRKELVSAVAQLTGWASVYKGAPSFAFVVNNYIIDRNGTLVYDERTSTEEIRNLLTALSESGFVFEGEIDEAVPVSPEQNVPTTEIDTFDSGSVESDTEDQVEGERTPQNEDTFSNVVEVLPASTEQDAPTSETDTFDSGSPESDTEDTVGNERTPQNGDPFANVATAEVSDMLVIEVPLDGFTKTTLDNLDRIVNSKAALIMKALGLPESNDWNDLPIKETKTTLQFPWFPLPTTKDETDAYIKFVLALCELAKKQKRVTMKDADVDSEKYAMRCFLLRLGFIGDEYKSARRVLLSKLSGGSSFKSGNHKRNGELEAVTNADTGVENAEGITVGEDENNTDSGATNGTEVPYTYDPNLSEYDVLMARGGI